MLNELLRNELFRRLEETVAFVRKPSASPPSTPFFTLDEKMRHDLLLETLKYIVTAIPFYKEWHQTQGKHLEINRVFEKLPILNRSVIYENHIQFVNPNITPTGISCTSGTTDLKRRMIIPHHKIERHACLMLAELYLLLAGRQNEDQQGEICLRLIPAMRRIFTPGASDSGLSITAMIDYDFPKYRTRTDYYDYIIQVLNSTYPIQGKEKRITSIHVTPPFLIDIFSRELLDRGVHPSVFKVKKITCTGGVVSHHFRKKLKDIWSANVICNFSHTEANVPYFECPRHPNRYHSFIGNFIEVLDERTDAPVENYEEGKLVVSTLFPFQIVHPFIRYFMGDYVRKIPDNCECGFIGQTIEWIGRQNHCISLEHLNSSLGRTFIGTLDVYEAIENEKEIVQIPFPQFNLHYDKANKKVNVYIECTVIISPKESKTQANRIASKLYRSLVNRIKRRGIKVISNPFCVTLLSKGSLKEPYFIGT